MPTLDLRDHPGDELEEIRSLARPLDDPDDLGPLLDAVGDARYVLLGEASHGTGDYYRWRAELTKRLITEKGFSFVAVEGDWPDCFAVNQWVKGRDRQDESARGVLGAFDRWPTWMWANDEVADFVSWLRDLNVATGGDVGFYGLDVYSLWESLHRIIGYLAEHDPDAIGPATAALGCFQPYGEDPQEYARATALVPNQCQDEVLDLLVAVQGAAAPPPGSDAEAELDALQNAEVLAGAERYYRTMMGGGGDSWNVRDCHMADTFDRLLTHHGPGTKAVIWEHNTHVGDARATDMAAAGMVNVGQLVRERHGPDDSFLVGFAGHRGSVIAAHRWGGPMRRLPVPEAPKGTHEDLLHRALGRPAVLTFPERRDGPWLGTRRGHRAIGVVYQPERDAWGNWVPTVMGARYDALCSFEQTGALHPIHLEPAAAGGELDTYPWGG